MQAFTRTSMQMRGSDLPGPHQSLHYASPSQSGHYSVQHVHHSLGHTPSYPNSTSSTFQSTPCNRNNLHGPQQTFSNQKPGHSSQSTYHSLQQQVPFGNQVSTGLCNAQLSHSSSQPNSGLAHLQPSQEQFSGSQNKVHYRPSGSFKPLRTNVNVQQLLAGHQNVPTVNLNHYGQSLNTSFQDYKTPHGRFFSASTSFQSVPSSGLPVSETNQNHCRMQTTYQPAPQPQQKATNANQTFQIRNFSQVQISPVRNGASCDSTAQLPTVAQVPKVTSAQLPPYTGSHILTGQGQLPYNVNPVQNSSYRPHNTHVSQSQSNYTVPMGQTSPSVTLQRFVQSQSEQNKGQSSSGCSALKNIHSQGFIDVSQNVRTRQATQQCNTAPFSDCHKKISQTSFPAHQYNNVPQDQQGNSTMDVLTGNSQDTMSYTSTSVEESLPSRSGHGDYSKVTLLDLLLVGNSGVHRCDGSSVSTSINGQQRTTLGHPESVSVSTRRQGPSSTVLHCGVPPDANEREILIVSPSSTKERSTGVYASATAKFEGAEFRRLQMNSNTLASGRHISRKRHREVEHCTDQADCLEVVAALQKAAFQVQRAVAIVSPISQQADPGKKGDAVSPSMKSRSKGSKMNAPNLPNEMCKELCKAQKSIRPENKTAPSTRSCEEPQFANSTANSSQILDSAQTKNAVPSPKSQSQSPNMHQAPVLNADVSAKSLEGPNDQNVKSHSDDEMYVLSTVPVIDCTLRKLQHLVSWMTSETINIEEENELETDVTKHIVDLYWDGDIHNIGKEVKLAKWAKTMAEMCVKEKDAVVFQHVRPEHLKRLACHYIMEHETTLPANSFRSSWLNVDENPPDIDKVLAEPLSDYDFPWCKDASLSISDGTVIPVDSLVQVKAAEDTVVFTQNISEGIGSAVNPLLAVVQISGHEDADCIVSPNEKIPEITSDSTTVSALDCVVKNGQHYVASQVESNKTELSENVLADFFSSPQILISLELESNDVIEPKMLNEIKHTPIEVPAPASHLSTSDLPVESDVNSYEKEDLSSASSTSDDPSVDVVLLSTDDAAAIFEEQEEPAELCLDEADYFVCELGSLFGMPELRSCRPSKFTCPHVTDTTYDGDHFCAKCLDETPLLDVDLNESLLSPTEDGYNVKCSPLEPDSSSSESSNSPLPEPHPSVSPESINTVPEEVYESSTVVKVHKSIGQTKNKEKVKHSDTECVLLPKHKQFKKNKLSKSKQTPTEGTEDVLFTPDIVIRMNSPHKKYSDTHMDKMDRRNEERQEEIFSPIETIIQTNKQSTQTDPDSHQMAKTVSATLETSNDNAVWPKNLVIHKLKELEPSTRSNSDADEHQSNGCIKQVTQGLSLYGSCHRSSIFMHQCHDGERSFSVPVHIKVSSATASTNDGKNYTYTPSAKQKIYKKWFSSLVQKQNSSSYNCKNRRKNELKVILRQKNIMKARATSKSDSENSPKRDLKHKGNFIKTPEAKKLKCTAIEDYFACT